MHGVSARRRLSRHLPSILLMMLLLSCGRALPATAAISCELNYPASDVARLFPDSSSYQTKYFSFADHGGKALLDRVETRLGKSYLALYAPLDVPYTLYPIYRGDQHVGYIHGVNQKGQYGVIELFVALDMEGAIKAFYIQKISGRWGKRFTAADFGKQFIGLVLKDFEDYDPASGQGGGRLKAVQNPAPEAETDFYGILRGLKKNLVLMDEFFYSANKGKQ